MYIYTCIYIYIYRHTHNTIELSADASVNSHYIQFSGLLNVSILS